MFSFFLKSYRKGLLTFGGEGVNVFFDINGPQGKETIRRYENGQYKDKPIITKHPNIVRAVILGKKSWGLHVKMWSDGISEWCFTEEEILKDFNENNILIPNQLELDFKNWVEKKKKNRYN